MIWDKALSVGQGTKVRQDGTGFAVCSTAWYFDGGDHQDMPWRMLEVLEPPALRERVVETCREILAFHDEPLPAATD